MDFKWNPGIGIDRNAIERMKQHFPRPEEPPAEAWFMGEKQGYWTQLVEKPVSELETVILEHYLADTGSGIKNFSRREDWVRWFHYLLPRLLDRIYDGALLDLTID